MTDTSLAADEFTPDTDFCSEFKITKMTLWRWDRDPLLIEMGLPPPIRIRGRKYRSRKMSDKFKQTMLRQAIARRGGKAA